MPDVFALPHADAEHEQKAADLETEVRRLRVRLAALTSTQWRDAREGQARSRVELVRDALRQVCLLTSPPGQPPAIWKTDEAELPSRLFALLEMAQPRRGADAKLTNSVLGIAIALRRGL